MTVDDGTAPELACSLGAMLGEGPVWCAASQSLWFVDIKGLAVHRFDAASRALQSWTAPSQPGWVLPMVGGRLLAGLQAGLHAFDPATGRFEALAAPEADRPGNRLNDACVDGAGRVWFGSMHDAEAAASGRVYLLDDGQISACAIPPVTIANGPAVSPDGRTLYFVDTLAGRLDAYEIAADGGLSNRRVFAQISPADGHPDGHPDGPTVDSEGCVWIGLFGGWGVRRYSAQGELLEQRRFPVANVTKIAFGGPDLCTAYATTARLGLSAEQCAQQPLAGDLFSFRVAVPGLATTLVPASALRARLA